MHQCINIFTTLISNLSASFFSGQHATVRRSPGFGRQVRHATVVKISHGGWTWWSVMAFAHVASGCCASSALCAALASSATHRSVAEQPGGAELQREQCRSASCTSAAVTAVVTVVLSCASCRGSIRGGGRFELPWP